MESSSQEQKQQTTIKQPSTHLAGRYNFIYEERKETNRNFLIKTIGEKTCSFVSDKAKDLDINKSYYIHGGVGTGKTVLMKTLLEKSLESKESEMVSHNEKITIYNYDDFPSIKHLWINMAKLTFNLYDTFNNKGSAKDIIDTLCLVDKLYIDDLGCEKTSDYLRHALYLIINERHDHEKTTVITSNIPLSRMSEIDARISSRIAGMCEVLELSGIDMRINKR